MESFKEKVALARKDCAFHFFKKCRAMTKIKVRLQEIKTLNFVWKVVVHASVFIRKMGQVWEFILIH